MLGLCRILIAAACAAAASAAVADGDAPHGGAAQSTTWLDGRALEERLAQPVDVNWSAAPLRGALYGLARTHQAAVLLDRRVDPDGRVELVLHDLPLRQALAEIAARRSAATAQLGPVTYLGPPEVAGRLGALAELRRREAANLTPTLARRLLAERPLRWDDLAEPRRLLADLAHEAGLEIEGLEQVPHDLWAGADLPALAWVDRLTLVALQFDLTFSIASNGRTLRLVAIPDRLPAAKARPETSVAPRTVKTRRTPHSPQGEKRYTLRQAKGQLRELLPKLAAMLQLELRIDEEALARAGISLDRPVSVSATDVTAGELLQKLLEPAGCTFRREGHQVLVIPKP
jgi:hypothetical protein